MGVGVNKVNPLVVEIIFDLLFTLAKFCYAGAWSQRNLAVAEFISVVITANNDVAVNKAFQSRKLLLLILFGAVICIKELLHSFVLITVCVVHNIN